MRDAILSERGNLPAADVSVGTQDLPSHLFTQPRLARRWRLSGRTLEKWNWTKQGHAHLKLAWRVVYRLKDSEAVETQQRRVSAAK